MKRWMFFVPAAVFAVLVIYFAVGLTKDPSIVPSALIDKPAPTFDLTDIASRGGPGFSSEDLRQGKVSVVNVFASWCVPCRVEHPLINDLAERGIVNVYGLNYKDKDRDAAAWLDALGDHYTAVGADRDGRVGIDWGVYGVPETFVVDGAGCIQYKHISVLTRDVLEEEIMPRLQGKKHVPCEK